jgi:hypothetical protein
MVRLIFATTSVFLTEEKVERMGKESDVRSGGGLKAEDENTKALSPAIDVIPKSGFRSSL